MDSTQSLILIDSYILTIVLNVYQLHHRQGIITRTKIYRLIIMSIITVYLFHETIKHWITIFNENIYFYMLHM